MKNYFKCPHCGRLMFHLSLASNPGQYESGCNSCGFSLRYWDRKDRYAPVTQEELNEFYEEHGYCGSGGLKEDV